MKKIILLLIAAIPFSSCVKEDGLENCPAPVRFAGSIDGMETRVQGADGNIWTTNDHVGIYMVQGSADGLSASSVIESNIPYYASSTAETTTLLPVASALFFPDDNSPVKFVAYHPYHATKITDDFRYEVELVDQSDQSKIDLLHAATPGTYTKSAATDVSLEFKHVLCKLIFTVSYGDGATAPANNAITIGVSNQHPKATLFLSGGYAIGLGATGSLTSTGTTSKVEMITAPCPSTEGIVFTITNSAGEVFTVAPPVMLPGWTGGFRYTYNIVLRGDRAGVSSTIDPWVDAPNSANGQVDVIYGNKIN